MDGFKLLEAIGLELDLPVISESAAGGQTLQGQRSNAYQLSPAAQGVAMRSQPCTRGSLAVQYGPPPPCRMDMAAGQQTAQLQLQALLMTTAALEQQGVCSFCSRLWLHQW
jgi:hypothetical protein